MAALRSIYDESFQDQRTEGVWKVWRPPEFEIKILPENTTQGYCEAHVSVSVRIKFSARYPLDSPDIDLTSPRGLSSSQLQDLQQSLNTLREQFSSVSSEKPCQYLCQKLPPFPPPCRD